jgi:DNA-directed RNA polymerase specialized sigma24 family protein
MRLKSLTAVYGLTKDRRLPSGAYADVLDQLIRQSEQASVFQALMELPSDQQEALLVQARAQRHFFAATDLPKTITELAVLRRCSRDTIHKLSRQAKATMRAKLAIRENKGAN